MSNVTNQNEAKTENKTCRDISQTEGTRAIMPSAAVPHMAQGNDQVSSAGEIGPRSAYKKSLRGTCFFFSAHHSLPLELSGDLSRPTSLCKAQAPQNKGQCGLGIHLSDFTAVYPPLSNIACTKATCPLDVGMQCSIEKVSLNFTLGISKQQATSQVWPPGSFVGVFLIRSEHLSTI